MFNVANYIENDVQTFGLTLSILSRFKGVCVPSYTIPGVCSPTVCTPASCCCGGCCCQTCMFGGCCCKTCVSNTCIPEICIPGVCSPAVTVPEVYINTTCFILRVYMLAHYYHVSFDKLILCRRMQIYVYIHFVSPVHIFRS